MRAQLYFSFEQFFVHSSIELNKKLYLFAWRNSNTHFQSSQRYKNKNGIDKCKHLVFKASYVTWIKWWKAT